MRIWQLRALLIVVTLCMLPTTAWAQADPIVMGAPGVERSRPCEAGTEPRYEWSDSLLRNVLAGCLGGIDGNADLVAAAPESGNPAPTVAGATSPPTAAQGTHS